ncbi:hypothetical protein FGG08_006456 [Glutinoglossum americanum]|uniref:NACHT domain-containing protein n=1 Tax=Glutinoglossum americanum TaxID=1670608 RepID=A0A9P8HW05_9PEZI|nr:hypothetical protein FGG08_006456 [Glutinoglossum americanum]
MDPVTVVGLAASIIQVINATTKAIKYLNDVKGAPKDRARLAREATSLLALLTDLRYMVEEAKSTDSWFTCVSSLGVEMGPIEQFKSEMEELARKLKPQSGIKKLGKTLLWTLDKNEINNILSKIERLKTRVGLALQKDHFALSQAIKDDIAEVTTGITELRVDQEGKESRPYLAVLLATHDTEHSGKKELGNGYWRPMFSRTGLMEPGEFCGVLDFVKAGAGKTILVSIVVDYLERSFEKENVAIAYIYCSYKEQEDQTVVNLIASLLQQLVQRNPIISDEVMSLHRSHIRKRTRPKLDEYSSLLQSEVCRFSKVFIVIDALDECPESKRTRDNFLVEVRKLQPRIHLLVTSRHVSTIEREFEKSARVEIRASDEDVKRYLEGRVKTEGRLVRHVKADPALQDTIVNTIAEKAKGIRNQTYQLILPRFLLAQLHMDSLAKKHNRRDVRTALRNLPKELDDTYDEAMQRIRGQDEEDAKLAERILYWISYAFRPLTVTEIKHALAVQPGDVDFDEEAMPDVLVSICAGLVTVDRESNITRLVHYTTQEYFERTRMTWFPNAQTNIATTCLTYISFDVFAQGYCRSDQEFEIRMQKYPLLEYAAQHWGDHARGDPEEAIKEIALKFLKHNSKVMCSSQVTGILKYRYPGYSQTFPKHVTSLHIVASIGLTTMVRPLLECEGVDTNSKGSNGRTPLSWAAGNGHEAVVRMLVEHESIDADSKDSYGRTPLSWAAGNGHEAVVRMLVEHEGVDADSKGHYGWTPLLWAAKNGHEAVVRMLVELEGVDADSKDTHGRTPLSLAAINGHEVVVRMLVKHEGIDADSKDSHGQTPLSLAAINGHEAVVRMLVKHEGIDADSKDSYGRTPLSRAAGNGHEAVVRLLVEHEGTDADSKDPNGQTPLSWAAKNGHEAVVQLLAERKDVDISTEDFYSRTPLSWAAENGREAVVRVLAEHGGVDVDSKDYRGQTPLSLAAENGHEAVVRLLVEHGGVDADSKNSGGQTPLSWAARNGHDAVVRLLVEHEGVDVDSKDYRGQTPLSLAAENGHEAVVRLLVEHEGVDADSKDFGGQTPLSWAARNGHDAVMRMLVEHEGVDVDSKDYHGQTPLSLAAENGHEAVVRLLVEHEGVDADSKDSGGQTPLSWAARNGHDAVMRPLAEREGVDIDTKDFYSRTPLSWAARYGHEAVVRMLVEYEDVDVNSKDYSYGERPLSRAAGSGCEATARLPVEHEGVDANSGCGRTPLSWAIVNEHKAVVRLLIACKGVDVNCKDPSGHSLVTLAILTGNGALVRLLTMPSPGP